MSSIPTGTYGSFDLLRSDKPCNYNSGGGLSFSQCHNSTHKNATIPAGTSRSWTFNFNLTSGGFPGNYKGESICLFNFNQIYANTISSSVDVQVNALLNGQTINTYYLSKTAERGMFPSYDLAKSPHYNAKGPNVVTLENKGNVDIKMDDPGGIDVYRIFETDILPAPPVCQGCYGCQGSCQFQCVTCDACYSFCQLCEGCDTCVSCTTGQNCNENCQVNCQNCQQCQQQCQTCQTVCESCANCYQDCYEACYEYTGEQKTTTTATAVENSTTATTTTSATENSIIENPPSQPPPITAATAVTAVPTSSSQTQHNMHNHPTFYNTANMSANDEHIKEVLLEALIELGLITQPPKPRHIQ
jgi:hypothetical protein